MFSQVGWGVFVSGFGMKILAITCWESEFRYVEG